MYSPVAHVPEHVKPVRPTIVNKHLNHKIMAIQNAMLLLSNIDTNTDLRTKLNKCNTKSELFDCLQTNNLSFDFAEFEESVNLMHVKCQTQEQADYLFEKVNWFRFLYYSLKND